MSSDAGSVDRDQVTQLLAGRASPPDEEFVFGAERVTIALEGPGNGPFRVRKRDFEWVVDEPPERGGQDSGANPLAYFLSGAATCLLSHWMLNAIADGVAVEELRLNARARYNRVEYGGAFRDVVYDLKLRSDADPEVVRALAERSEAMCYAHTTLVNAGVKLTTNVVLNGDPLFTLEK